MDDDVKTRRTLVSVKTTQKAQGGQVRHMSNPTNEVIQGPGSSANDDGVLNISDPIFELRFLFVQGSAPPAPVDLCGFDPSEDELACDGNAACGVK